MLVLMEKGMEAGPAPQPLSLESPIRTTGSVGMEHARRRKLAFLDLEREGNIGEVAWLSCTLNTLTQLQTTQKYTNEGVFSTLSTVFHSTFCVFLS